MPAAARRRCAWAQANELLIAYHDEEWGRPLHDDRALFEMLTLEGAQAGLSWLTILKKRDAYRRAFRDFDAEAVARFAARDVARLLRDPGIVRNRLKIESTVANARAVLAIREEFGSLDRYLWGLVGDQSRRNAPRTPAEVPASTPVSDRMSRELRRRGLRFVGTTICYAFMQAIGMVDDHTADCFRSSSRPPRSR